MTGPASVLFECEWHVPMIQSNIRNKVQFQTFINYAMIEGNSFLIYFSRSFGQNSCPGNRETEDLKTKCFYQQEIVLISMIKITGDIWLVVAFDFSIATRE